MAEYDDKDHALYYELAVGDDEGVERVKVIVAGTMMVRQRFDKDQVRPHWKVFPRNVAEQARETAAGTVTGHSNVGARFVVPPLLFDITPEELAELTDARTVPGSIRNKAKAVADANRVPYAAARPGT